MTTISELTKEWYCPSCHLEHQSQGKETAWHNCPAINGAFIPLIMVGVDATNRVLLREDYVGEDICSVRDKNNQVIMSISQEHADGSNALTVFVPCATIKGEALKPGISATIASAEVNVTVPSGK